MQQACWCNLSKQNLVRSLQPSKHNVGRIVPKVAYLQQQGVLVQLSHHSTTSFMTEKAGAALQPTVLVSLQQLTLLQRKVCGALHLGSVL